MKVVKFGCVCFLAAALIIVATSAAFAGGIQLTHAYIPVKGTNYVYVTEQFADRINKAVDGKVEIILNDSVVNGTQLAQAVRDDRVQITTILAGYYSATNPEFGLAQLPGLMNNFDEYKKVFYGFWKEDLNRLIDEKYNGRALVWGLFYPQNLISIKPVKTVADFKGKKIRVHNIETGTLVSALGAQPTPMSAAEVLPALQRGIIDGVFTSSGWAYGQAFYTVAKYVSNWPISTILPFPIVINKDEWNKLPKDVQDIISAESEKLEKDTFDGYADIVANFPKKWAEKGVEYFEPPASEIELLFKPENITKVYDAFFERAEKAGFDGRAYVKRGLDILGKDLKY